MLAQAEPAESGVMEAVWRWDGLSDRARRAYEVLWRASASGTRPVPVTYEWLALQLDRTRSSAERYVSELRAAGLLARVARESRGYLYRVLDAREMQRPHLARGLDPQRPLEFAAEPAPPVVAQAPDDVHCSGPQAPGNAPDFGTRVGRPPRESPAAPEKNISPQVRTRPIVGETPQAVVAAMIDGEARSAPELRYRTLSLESIQDIDIAHSASIAPAAGPMTGAGPMAGVVAAALDRLCDPARLEREKRRLVAHIRQRCPDPKLQVGPCFRAATAIVEGRLDHDVLEGILARGRGNGRYLVGALQRCFREHGIPWERAG